MCYLCLQDFSFELPVKPNLDQKKKRLLKVKSLLELASNMKMENLMDISNHILCEDKIEVLINEQYKLSREF